MAKKIKLFSKRIIARLFQILGISSLLTAFGCTDPYVVMYGSPVDMYGTPSNYFTLDGKIVDDEQNPIKNIKVSVTTDDEEKNKYKYSEIFAYSDESGYFIIQWNDYRSSDMDFIINLEDIDGADNGSFNNKTLNANYKKDDMTDKGSWTSKYNKDLGTIKLEKKADNTENNGE